jgi:hypothetical protein
MRKRQISTNAIFQFFFRRRFVDRNPIWFDAEPGEITNSSYRRRGGEMAFEITTPSSRKALMLK